MKWSFNIGKLAGISVNIHATFFLILVFVAAQHYFAGETVRATLVGLAFVLTLFLCVLLHELGHSLMARRFGIGTKDITLLPIGGVARIERMPEDPMQELWIALAGPAVNLVIASALFVVMLTTDSFQPLQQLSVGQGSFIERLALVNLFLVLFNMLPAFPMDGGRVLRAILSSRYGHLKATGMAAGVGQGMALLFALLGLFTNPFLLFIAFFVWIGAANENMQTQVKSTLEGVRVEDAMLTNFDTISPDNKLSDLMQLVIAGSQQDFPVVYGDRVVGIVTRDRLLMGLAQTGESTSVSEIMRRDFLEIESAEGLEGAFQKMQESDCKTVPVRKDGSLVGLITMDNVGEFVMIRTALENARAARFDQNT